MSNIPGIQGHLRWPNTQVLANLDASDRWLDGQIGKCLRIWFLPIALYGQIRQCLRI